MGIYPTVTRKGEQTGILLTSVEEPGLKTLYIYELIATVVDRSDCFCCSCEDREGSDVFCRNHGWFGARPCEKHDMPGKASEDGFMPLSIEKILEDK